MNMMQSMAKFMTNKIATKINPAPTHQHAPYRHPGGYGAAPQSTVRSAVLDKPLQYLLIVGVALAVIYFYARQVGKRTGVKVSTKFPAGPDAVTVAWQQGQGTLLVTNVRKAIAGVSINDIDKAVAIKPLLGLSDNQLAWIAKEYVRRYSSSLIDDLEGEYFGFEGATRDEVLYRLRNIKTTA